MAKVLIVDDIAFARLRMGVVVTRAGHEVIEAVDGLDAVEKFSSERPAAVFLDLAMPMMGGLQALREIREIDRQALVTIVTGHGQEGIVAQALNAGAVDFIIKPYDNHRILAALGRMLGEPQIEALG